MSHETLLTEGTQIYSYPNSPLSNEDWVRLIQICHDPNLDFELVKTGDTAEDALGKVCRIKRSQNPEIFYPTVMDFFSSPQLTDFYKTLMNGQSYRLDRCQIVFYETGGFLAQHLDIDSYKSYKYAVVFFLNDDYEGGEFVVQNGDQKSSYKPAKNTVLVTNCSLPHEVLKITSGQRKVAHVFLEKL